MGQAVGQVNAGTAFGARGLGTTMAVESMCLGRSRFGASKNQIVSGLEADLGDSLASATPTAPGSLSDTSGDGELTTSKQWTLHCP